MKKLLLLLFPIISYCQVGINTTSPTSMLDVNGDVRIRSTSNGTVEVDSQGVIYNIPYKTITMGIANQNGVILKGFGSTITRLDNITYLVTFNTPQVDNKYIILLCGKLKHLFYTNPTANSFEIKIDANPSAVLTYEFNYVAYKLF